MTGSLRTSSIEPGLLRKVTPLQAKNLCNRFQLSKESSLLIQDHFTSAQFLRLLISESHYSDAIRLLAFGLPIREAIWWAYLCVHLKDTSDPNSDTHAALKLVKSWVYSPNEIDRRAAQKLAEKSEFKTPASWVAIAVFWSGGSITPTDAPPTHPAEGLAAKAITGAILLAGAFYSPHKMDETYLDFLERGMDIANGGNGEL